MTVKDLVSSHQRVAESHKDVIVMVGIYDYTDDLPLLCSIDEAIQEYGDCLVKNWFQTSETTSKGILLIEIDILIGVKA